MIEPAANDPAQAATPDAEASPRRVQSWLLSAVFHLIVFLVLGLTLRLAPRQGAMAERTADVGIVLKHQDGQSEYYEGETDGSQQTQATGVAAPSAGVEQLFSDTPPLDPSDALPAPTGIIGPSALAGGGPGHAGGALVGGGGPPRISGGMARARVYGTEGEGHKFVYVFDRSASMGGSGRNALSAAKAELLKSLESLDTTHQFQIIFYNDTPVQFNPAGRKGKLAFANEQTKRLAANFVNSIIAAGTTRHTEALTAAIRLQPDVIFFLTDADVPRLSNADLTRIADLSAGITINTIEFGLGPESGQDNFLKKLARLCGGQYYYVDVFRLLSEQKNTR